MISANLERFNSNIFEQVRNGTLSGPNLDSFIVSMEQTYVEDMLTGMESKTRKNLIAEMNVMMNDTSSEGGSRFASGLFSKSDRSYITVIRGVRQNLGRDIDYSNQADREMVGRAMAEYLRQNDD